MKDIFSVGDTKQHSKKVLPDDVARFESGTVHNVCATFTLAREIEWASRLFVLEMKEADEEGIGTMLSIEHKSPALVGDVISITAKVKSIIKNELICTYTVYVNDRLIAVGETGQKVLKKTRLDELFATIK